MPTFLSRYATPLTTGLFLVSLISGIALFFHWGEAAFHGMHEWLSMVLIVPFGLHVWKNWRPLVTYFKRPPMAIALALSLAGGIAFAVPALTAAEGSAGGPPQFKVLEAVSAAKLETIAPLFGLDADGMAQAMREKGYKVENATQTFTQVAQASGKTTRDIMGSLGQIKH